MVYLTQNLVAASVPDSIARKYVLSPASTSSAAVAKAESMSASAELSLPRATHNDGSPQTLYTTSIQAEIPLIIHPIDKETPWDADCFHSTSRNLQSHPSVGSFGLFAGTDIQPNTFIRPYLGVLHTKADADFHSTYDLSLCHDERLRKKDDGVAQDLKHLSLDTDSESEQDPTALYLDSRFWGNESRFVNDYRGIASKPNVEFRSFVQREGGSGEETFQMGLFAVRLIRKGQELVINYGKSYWIHHEQLAELESKEREVGKAEVKAEPPTAKLDPIQAMLARSRSRITKSALSRPPPAPSRTYS